ncbi:hypothetical protein ACH5RR_031132 [Cinchona calisaya]|uniref:SANT domain-containing protein n=1 Tax=Cinchona calisaya TaxID=153742 RepID=A0ABD2YIL8_9GENT
MKFGGSGKLVVVVVVVVEDASMFLDLVEKLAMDFMESDENGHLSNDMSIDQSPPLHEPIGCGLFKEQDIFPRIGASYQVEVPQLVQRSEYLYFLKNVENTENEYLMGLSIPVTVLNQDYGREESKEVVENLEFVNKDPLNVELHNRVQAGGSGDVVLEDKMELCRFPDFCFVPSSSNAAWSDLGKKCFLLGLYIFEKNFVQLRRFLESKAMGDILSFYYGEFYRSNEYCRWSECRKLKSKRFVFGQKIFTGLRLQEFLSRLIPSVSEECKNALLEVSKTYVEGKMLLEEYVSSLKAMVGMSLLVEVVGIGKGKQDLTGMAVEPSRSNQANPMRPEIPIGKACSSLTSCEIVKFLTGDYRLSKARSNDLFWEAVWPRLLARGWHSEEPKDQVYAAGSKNSLVFLVPGVKKFSRRRLVKGNHYFDSVSDVLSKVAAEPGIIELDNEEDDSKRNKEDFEWNNNRKLEEEDVPNQRRHFYLQPRTPNRISNGMKFTVIDTSLEDGEPFKVKELRNLRNELTSKFNPGNSYEISDDDDDSAEVSTEELDSADTALPNKGDNDISSALDNLSNGDMLSDRKDLEMHVPNLENHTSYPDSESIPVGHSMKRKQFSEDNQPMKEVVEQHLTQSTKEDNVDDICPSFKRARGLIACNQPETSNVMINPAIVPMLESEMPSCGLDICDFAENVPSQVVSSLDKVSLTSLSKGSPTESVEYGTVDSHDVSDPQENSQNQRLIDLNIPQAPVDFESGSLTLMADTMGEKEDKTKNLGDHDEPDTVLDMVSSDQQVNDNPQRRSTRYRPTTRALEAVAHGYLSVNKRRKGKEASSGDNLTSRRPSRRARGGAGLGVGMQALHQPTVAHMDSGPEFSTSTVGSAVLGGENVARSDGDRVMFNEFEVLPPEHGATISGN